jgi:hypothetical protein
MGPTTRLKIIFKLQQFPKYEKNDYRFQLSLFWFFLIRVFACCSAVYTLAARGLEEPLRILLELYRSVTSSFFGIGILPVSDLLDFGISVGIDPPLFCILPPFPPPFFQKGVELLKKGAVAPLLRKKGGTAPFFIPKCTDRIFLRYRYGKYQEIPTEYRPKIPNRYTTLNFT